MNFKRTYCTTLLSAALILGCAVPKPESFATEEALLKQADKLFSKRDFSESLPFYDSLLQRFPQSPLRVNAELKIADAKFEKGEYIEAESAYATFKSLHPTHEKMPYVTYRMALCHDKEAPRSVARDQLHTQRAVQILTDLKTQWPSSEETKISAPLLDKNVRKLKGQEMYVADFYMRKKKYVAALGRLKDLASDGQFPDIQAEAQYKLAYSLLKTGDKESAKPLLTGLESNPLFKSRAALLLQQVK